MVLDWLPLSLPSITRRIASTDTLSATLATADRLTPPDWANLIDIRKTMIVPVWEHEQWGVSRSVPLNAYYVSDIDGLRTPTPTLQLASLEGAFDRVFVADHEADDDDLADVATVLLSQKITAGFGLDVAATLTGEKISAAYSVYEDRTVGQVLSEFYDAGMEWCLRYDWTTGDHTHVAKTIELGPTTGITRPDAIFNDGNATATAKLSWTSETGAVRVWAVGDGSGDTRQMSAPEEDAEALAGGVPPWELRRSYTAMTDEAHAQRLAVEALADARDGRVVWSLHGDADRAPLVGAEWDIGDTIPVDFPAKHGAPGLTGELRVSGWEMTLEGNVPRLVTPMLPEVAG
jgi:hypothetical protein